MIRQSYTATIEQNTVWSRGFATEPYEAAWASEAIFFIRALKATGISPGSTAEVQISPDGINWCQEGTSVSIPTIDNELTFGRVKHFGGFLRLVGELADGTSVKVMVYLVLKE